MVKSLTRGIINLMRLSIYLVQIILGVLLMIAILLQHKGSGVGSSFGGDSGMYRSKRGAEKIIFYATIVISALFVLSALIGLLIK